MAQIITGYEREPQELIDSLMERVPVGDADELHSALIALARIVRAQGRQIDALQMTHGSTGLPASIQEALNSGDGTYRP